MRARTVVSMMLALGALGGTHSSKLEAAIGQALDPLKRVPGPSDATQINPRADEGATGQRGTTAPRANPLWAVPLSELSATRERPLFSPSRRLPAVFAPAAVAARPASPPPPPPRAERPPLVLVGTIIGRAEHIGIFVEEPTQKMIRLNLGEGHAGWVLQAVSTLDVRFEKADQAATLTLRPSRPDGANSAGVTVTEAVVPVRHRKRP